MEKMNIAPPYTSNSLFSIYVNFLLLNYLIKVQNIKFPAKIVSLHHNFIHLQTYNNLAGNFMIVLFSQLVFIQKFT